jgi:hypothetical protein
MNGLLDFLQTPAGQGLLSAGLGAAASAGRGRGLLGNIGQGGLMGLQAYTGAIESQKQQLENQQAREVRALQLKKMQQDMSTDEAMRAAAQASVVSPDRANAMSQGPMPDGSTVAQVAPGFDSSAYLNRLFSIDPTKAVAFQQSLAKDSKFNKVDAKDYTGPSVAKFSMTGNYADLVPVRKREVATNGQVFDPYEVQPGQVFADPNKAFALGPNGQPVPNLPFQSFELRKALASKPTIENKVEMVTETEWAKKRAGANADMMETINKTSFSAPLQIRKLERMEQLLNGVDGGKLAPTGLEIASAANSLGVKLDPKLGNKEAAQALSREIAAGFRQPGTGPMTDKDFDNFLLQVPDLSKTAAGRRQITATMKAAAARDIEVGKRARAYVKKNGKLDDNFVEEISQFVAENPVVKMPQGWEVTR